MTSPRWIVFGGSFDPPHRAHTLLPQRAAERLGASRILFVPARLNPLKGHRPPAPPHHRVAMLERAIAVVPGAEIRTLELDRTGPSYMVETLAELAGEAGGAAPAAELVLLVGADAALGFPAWREPARIATLAEVAVMLRPPFDETSFRSAYAQAWRTAGRAPEIEPRWVLDLGAIPASSSAVRAGAEDDLAPAVAAYIREHGLYRGREAG